MKIQNTSPKGKWIFVKIKGFTYKKWVSGYSSIILSEVTSLSDLNLNAHEEAINNYREKYGKSPDPQPTESTYFAVYATTSTATTTSVTGGTTSLSAATVYAPYQSNVFFSVHALADRYLSAYTINGVSQSVPVMSAATATTTYTISSISQDKAISVSFGIVS